MLASLGNFFLDPWLIGLAISGLVSLRWSFGLAPRRRRRQYLGALLLGALVMSAAGVAAYRWSLLASLAELRQRGEHRLELYTESMEREVTRYGYVPSILGLEQQILALLADGGADAALVGRVNVFLEHLNERAGTTAIYLMDARGKVLAASNWRAPDSFVGQDLSYRPYFTDAIHGLPGRFYGIGTTSGEPGYYHAYGIPGETGRIGVATAKISLEGLEQTWRTSEQPVLVTDEHDVVILSSVPAWKFASTLPLSAEQLAQFEQTRRYNGRPLPPLGLVTLETAEDGSTQVRLPASRRSELFDGGAGVFLVQQRPIEGSGWQLTVFSSTTQARGLALNHAALAVLAAALALVLLAVGKVRRRHIRERLAAREALQHAHDELERKVEQRTQELSTTVAQLQAEVAERIRAEASLRETQAGLVQAGKLAVIGQLSAGITHELNQPLAALRTLSGNTLKFLDRGRLDTVRSNLQTIDQMAERMGHITGELKRFARKSTGQQQAVAIRAAVANALFLVEQRIRRDRVEVQMNLGDEELRARCDQNRLEQVLVNLIGNAVDAVGEVAQGARRLEVNAWRDGEQVVLQVADNGPGLPQQVQQRLFEPFLTTKAPGVGLGLGLTISASIVREFGGELKGENRPEGGAVFTLRLPAATEEDHA